MDDLAILNAPAEAPVETVAVETTADASPEHETAPNSPAPEANAPVEAALVATTPETNVEIEYPDDDPAPESAAGDPTADSPAVALAQAGAAPDAPAARYGTAALTRILKENPALAQAAEANPRVRSQLYQMARRSQELAQYHDIAPSPARAREAIQAAQTLSQLEQVYGGQDSQSFWRALYDAQMRPDPQTGQSRSSGAYERHVNFLHDLFLDRMQRHARQSGNEPLSAAVTTFREALGWSQSSPAQEGVRGAAVESAQLPPQIRQKLQQAEVDARELEQLRTRRSEEERQHASIFLDDTAGEVASELRSFVDGMLANAKLSDYDKRNIARDFIEEVSVLADQDKVHVAALEEILRAGGATPATRARMVARAQAWARQNGREILEPILARAGAGLKQRQAQRDAVSARARVEPAAVGAPSAPRQITAREAVQMAEKRMGRRLSDREILELA